MASHLIQVVPQKLFLKIVKTVRALFFRRVRSVADKKAPGDFRDNENEPMPLFFVWYG